MAAGQVGRRMKIGLHVRPAERCVDDRTPRFRDIQDLVLAVEAIGVDAFWMPDHIAFRPGEPDQLGAWDVMTLLSALAATTSTITLGPLVAATSFRNPALLARIATAIDEISAGRFILGIGAGGWEAEHRRYGYPFDHQVGRFEEATQSITGLLRRGVSRFDGRWYAMDGELRPSGPTPSGPPIWVGGRGERTQRIAARYADGFNAIWPHTLGEVIAKRDAFYALCRDEGRDPATIEFTVGTHVHLPGAAPDDHPAIGGSDDGIAATLHDFADAGVGHVIIDLVPTISVGAVERFAGVLAAFDRMAAARSLPGTMAGP